MKATKTLRFALLAALVSATTTVRAQGGEPDAKEPHSKEKEKVAAEKIAWPDIKPIRLSMAKDKIPQLIHKNEAARAKARETIVGYGAGCAPVLLEALKPTQKPELLSALAEILDGFVESKHAPLLIEAWTGTNEVRDLYIISSVRRFGVEGQQAFFEKALVHGDARIRELATYSLAQLGDVKALHPLLLLTRDAWDDKNYQIRECLPKLKGDAATKWLITKLNEGAIADRIAILRLLHGVGTKDCAPTVGRLLDDSSHLIRAEAVNALRGIMDGAPPFKKLSVFQAIEEIKKWKARVGS